MPYLIKTPLFSYLINYFNDAFGFRESRISSLNRSATREIETYVLKKQKTQFTGELEKKGFNLEDCISKGSFENLFPLHVQIELTDNCNLFCDYCYRDSNYKSPNSKYINPATIQEFLLRNKERNLLEIGVTGGEPTMHPDFLNIVGFILNNFELVELVTNGTSYNIILRLFDIVGEDKKKLNLSVSFNKWMREMVSFKRGDHHLNLFLSEIANRHPLRVILTDFLYDEKEKREIEERLREKGVKDIDFSFVAPIGRGENKINELDYISLLGNCYDGMPFTINPFNCGLIFKHTAVAPEGNLRPCALFPTSYKIGSIGDSDGFVDEKNEALWTIPSPNKDICGDCEFLKYCSGCIYAGLFNSNKDCNYKIFIRNTSDLNFLFHIQ